jgi:hypothetical protein
LVAGAIALILEAQPAWDYGDVYRMLTLTASRSSNPDTVYGYGIIDLPAAISADTVVVTQSSIYPNPCSTAVTFRFPVDDAGVAIVQIYTTAAEEVRVLEREVFGAETVRMSWDMRNADGEEVANGVYLVLITGPGISETAKIFKLRE